VIGTEGHLGLVDLHDTHQGITVRIDHRAPQLLRQQPRGLIGAEAKLPHELLGRHAVRMRGHQMCRPEPSGERQLGPVHHRPGRHRGLLPAGGTLISECAAPQQVTSLPTAPRASKAIRPPSVKQEPGAMRLVRTVAEIRGASENRPSAAIMLGRPSRIQRNLGQRNKPRR